MERRFGFDYDAAGRLLRFAGMGPSTSWIAVTPTHVTVHLGWAFDATIPHAAILRAQRAASPRGFGSMLAGWGVHTDFRGTWYVNGSQRNLVRIDLLGSVPARTLAIPVSVRVLYVTPDDLDGFLAALDNRS